MARDSIAKYAYFGAAALAAGAIGTSTAHAQKIDGPYMGLSFGKANGIFNSGGFSGPYHFAGNLQSAYIGFNHTLSGGITVGGEFMLTDKVRLDSAGQNYFNSSTGLNNLIDLRARVGKSFGNVFVYGAAGLFNGDGEVVATPGTANGESLAIGVEYSVNKSMFVGAEAMRRWLNYSNVGNFSPSFTDYVGAHGTLNTVSLRVGLHF